LGQSTELAAYTVVNGILQAWNNKLQVVGILCDIAKAFDCVNHYISMGVMKQVSIGLGPIYTTVDKELTLILIMFKIAPQHGR